MLRGFPTANVETNVGLMLIVVNLFRVCTSRGYCSFPGYLWDQLQDGGQRTWLSRIEYIRDTDTWQKRKEITVNDTEIYVRMKLHASCSERRQTSAAVTNVPCFRQDALYRIICISEEPDMKFRVQVISNDRHMFSCMKFVQRSPGVVQVYQAVPIDINEHRLCYNASLQRDEWPWIDLSRPPIRHCSLFGGFDFRGYLGESRQKLCPTEWRPSRFESECVRSDGITLFFPHPDCSPFNEHITAPTLFCWSEWTEDGFVFFLLAEKNKTPKYMLRLPRSLNENVGVQPTSTSPLFHHNLLSTEGGVTVSLPDPKAAQAASAVGAMTSSVGAHQWLQAPSAGAAINQFLGFFYFSPVAPLGSHGNPPSRIMFVEMHVQRSELGTCIDETEECQEMAARGQCYTDSNVNQNANYCLRSCGMCELAPSTRSECHFAKEHIGRWVLFDDDEGIVTFEISSGEIKTSNIGSFICKGKHWQHPYYKVMSVFPNGCRPRYTCIHLLDSGDILQYRLSRSSLTDDSFNLCEFRDDGSPFGEKVRSSRMKTLIAFSNVKYNSCGLDATWRSNVTFNDRSSCNATISDVNGVTCSSMTSLRVSINRCSSEKPQSFDFSCIAGAQLSTGTRILVTKLLGEDRHSCWIVKPTWPKLHLHSIPNEAAQSHSISFTRGRCSTGEILPTFTRGSFIRSITAFQDKTLERCSQKVQSSPGASRSQHNQSLPGSSLGSQRPFQTPLPSHRISISDGQVAPLHGLSAPTIRRQPEYRRGSTVRGADGQKHDSAVHNGFQLNKQITRSFAITCSIVTSLISRSVT